MVIVALLAPVLATHDVNKQRLVKRLKGPSAEYLLGTDSYGRDFYSRLIYGARISLSVGLGGSLVAVVIASLVGGLSGYFGGKSDMVIQRFVDAWYAFPGLLYLVTFVSIFGRGLLEIILLMGLYVGITQSRVVRSAVIAIKAIPYVESAKATGCSTGRTLLRYILPNVTAPILIIFTTSIGGMILGEAALSFLGFGLPPQNPVLGTDAQLGRPHVHGGIPAIGLVSRPLPDRGGLWRQRFRRRHARLARPPFAWSKRRLRLGEKTGPESELIMGSLERGAYEQLRFISINPLRIPGR